MKEVNYPIMYTCMPKLKPKISNCSRRNRMLGTYDLLDIIQKRAVLFRWDKFYRL